MSPTVWRDVPLQSDPVVPQVITLPTQDASDVLPGMQIDDRLIIRHVDDPWWSLHMFWKSDGAYYSNGVIDMATDDAWAVDWSRQNLEDTCNGWRRPAGGVGWYRAGWTAYLQADVVSGANTVQVTSGTASANSIPPIGQASVRDRVITWTSVTDDGGNTRTLNGVTWSGPNGVTFRGLYTPVIPYAASLPGGGDAGGYGTTPKMHNFVGQLRAAGFEWQERLTGVMNASFEPKNAGVVQPGLAFTIAMHFVHVDDADDLGSGSNYPEIFAPPTNFMVGPGIRLVSTTDHLSGGDGGGFRDNERGFKERIADWQDCPIAFTKKRIKPVLYGTMGTVASNGVVTPRVCPDVGEAYQVTHSMRVRTDVI